MGFNLANIAQRDQGLVETKCLLVHKLHKAMLLGKKVQELTML